MLNFHAHRREKVSKPVPFKGSKLKEDAMTAALALRGSTRTAPSAQTPQRIRADAVCLKHAFAS